MADKACKDCAAELLAGTIDKIPARKLARKKGGIELAPGPRCVTHHRAFTKSRKGRAHDQYVLSTYSLGPGQYEAIYEAQGGTCFICQVSTGAARKLSVDHDHKCCDGPKSCGKCVRALLCRPHNDLLGLVRDDVEMLKRAIIVLQEHPAQAVLNSLDVLDGE